jgi:Cdc6-like AAA superfamily ATPase
MVAGTSLCAEKYFGSGLAQQFSRRNQITQVKQELNHICRLKKPSNVPITTKTNTGKFCH